MSQLLILWGVIIKNKNYKHNHKIIFNKLAVMNLVNRILGDFLYDLARFYYLIWRKSKMAAILKDFSVFTFFFFFLKILNESITVYFMDLDYLKNMNTKIKFDKKWTNKKRTWNKFPSFHVWCVAWILQTEAISFLSTTFWFI